MQLHNINDAVRLMTDLEKQETITGKSYNWVLANHFSLLCHIQENNLSMEQLFREEVLCEAIVNESEEQTRLNNHIYNCVMKTFYFGTRKCEYNFIDKQMCSVNLLFLLKVIFNYTKKLILRTRLHDTLSSEKTSQSVMQQNTDFIASKTKDLISYSLFCESDLFLLVKKTKKNSSYQWYVELSNEETNKENALKMYIKHCEMTNTPLF